MAKRWRGSVEIHIGPDPIDHLVDAGWPARRQKEAHDARLESAERMGGAVDLHTQIGRQRADHPLSSCCAGAHDGVARTEQHRLPEHARSGQAGLRLSANR